MAGMTTCVESRYPETEILAANESVSSPWMKKELLELWLRTYYGQVTVTECEVQPATVKGDNYLSVLHRLTVRTQGGQSHSLIVKCRIEEGKTARLVEDSKVFRREQEMYSTTLPRMSALLKKALPGTSEPISAKCMYACQSFLVLEDLSAVGFRMMDRLEGLDLDHCLLVMRSLARFHAASVALHEQDPDSLKQYEVSFYSEPSLYSSWKNSIDGFMNTLVEELETWPEHWHQYVTKLRLIQENIWERICVVMRRSDTGLNVLAHGDLWINNMMFNEHPSGIRLVDFQLATHTSPGIDLHLFICSSPTPEVRLYHTNTLLKEYHTALCDTLTALGYTQKIITLEELHKEFDRTCFYGLWMLIGPIACMLSKPGCGLELDDLFERGETPGPSMYSDIYRETVKMMLPVLDRQGAFGDTQPTK